MWFRYRQNNSGGSFDEEMGIFLFVEAACAAEADSRAENVGVYFYGVEDGRDCPCCGDRWDTASRPVDDLEVGLKTSLEEALLYGLPVAVLPSGENEFFKVVGLADPKLISAGFPEISD